MATATRDTTTPELTALAARPKRADARRNYDKLVTAAREVFAEQGSDATLEEISRRAEVGIGTLYRHFPARENLVEAAYLDGVEEVCAAVARHDGEDPWEALTGWLLELVSFASTKRVLADEMFAFMDRDAPVFQSCSGRSTTPASHSCCGLRRRAPSAMTSTSPMSPKWSPASRVSAPSNPTTSNASSPSPSTASAGPPSDRIHRL